MIEISQDKINGELFVNEFVCISGIIPQTYETNLYRCWVYATKDEALDKWNELNEAKADKARQVFAEGILKIDKIFS